MQMRRRCQRHAPTLCDRGVNGAWRHLQRRGNIGPRSRETKITAILWEGKHTYALFLSWLRH